MELVELWMLIVLEMRGKLELMELVELWMLIVLEKSVLSLLSLNLKILTTMSFNKLRF
jgi:hypothetical protein